MMSRAKVAGSRAKAKTNYLKEQLDERGLDYKEFATQMKEKFSINKKDTYDMIKGKNVIDIDLKIRINILLSISSAELLRW